MPVLTADGRRHGWITESEAHARGLTADDYVSVPGYSLPVARNERARVKWVAATDLAATVQPSGWSGGRHPDGPS